MRNGSRRRRRRRVFRQDPAAEVDDEIEFHLEERVRDYITRGMEPELARKAVIVLFRGTRAISGHGPRPRPSAPGTH